MQPKFLGLYLVREKLIFAHEDRQPCEFIGFWSCSIFPSFGTLIWVRPSLCSRRVWLIVSRVPRIASGFFADVMIRRGLGSLGGSRCRRAPCLVLVRHFAKHGNRLSCSFTPFFTPSLVLRFFKASFVAARFSIQRFFFSFLDSRREHPEGFSPP